MGSVSALAHEARLISKYFGSYPAKEVLRKTTQKLSAASGAELWRQIDGNSSDNAYPEPDFRFKKEKGDFCFQQAKQTAAEPYKV
jgi:hypothetical protein